MVLIPGGKHLAEAKMHYVSPLQLMNQFTLFLYSYLSGESSKWASGISDTWVKLWGAIRVWVEVKCRRGREARSGLFALGEILASFSLPLSLSGAAGSASTGKTIACFASCLELVLVAHHFCRVSYRTFCLHMRFVQITLQWTGGRQQMTQSRNQLDFVLGCTSRVMSLIWDASAGGENHWQNSCSGMGESAGLWWG